MPPVALRDLPGGDRHSDEFASPSTNGPGRSAIGSGRGSAHRCRAADQLWRAPTDNDRNIKHVWYRAGYDRLAPRVQRMEVQELSRHAIRLEVDTRLGAVSLRPSFDVRYCYTLYGSGDLVIETRLIPLQEDLPDLPRVGLELRTLPGFTQFAWYGVARTELYRSQGERPRRGRGLVEGNTCPTSSRRMGTRRIRVGGDRNLRGEGLSAWGCR